MSTERISAAGVTAREARADVAPDATAERAGLDRRAFVAFFSSIGLGGTLLPGVLWAQANQQSQRVITAAMIAEAEKIAGLEFSEEEREAMARGLDQNLRTWQQLREVTITNDVMPALHFDPVLPGMTLPTERRPIRISDPPMATRPANLEDVAFLPVRQLAELVRNRSVSSVELTEMYLSRLERHDAVLQCVISLTPERALEQARRADAEIAAGRYRGPLHGIPWGAKDLLAVRGYRTTWGAKPYEEQILDTDATVVQRLDEAGAVLVAKLTLGALAQGDQWYGGQTKNPWNPEQGSSGSSAGSAAATVAGLVGFSLGTETLGSIVSPSTRCGATGLRPTFGRVSRHGAMALSWSMDKIGPIARSVEDCALVFAAIHGPDGRDPTVHDLPFNWDATASASVLRVGYVASAFEGDRATSFDRNALEVLRGLGIRLVPVELPEQYPVNALRPILSAEAAAAFDDLTRSGRDDLMERSSWPNTFRTARLIPAVEYIQANRLRTLVMQATEAALANVDVVVTPSFGGNWLTLTNFTGHPSVTLPHGFADNGSPVSLSFFGRLYNEAAVLTVAKAFQDATDFHTRRPPRFA